MSDHRECEVTLNHQARIAKLEQGFTDHDRRICTLEKKIDKIIYLEWAALAAILGGLLANRLF